MKYKNCEMILYYAVCYNCVTNRSKLIIRLKKIHYFPWDGMSAGQVCLLLWVRLISAGLLLVCKQSAGWMGAGLSGLASHGWFKGSTSCSPFLQWAWVRLVFMWGGSPRQQEKALFQGLVAELLHYVLYHVLMAKVSYRTGQECEWKIELNFLIDGAIKLHSKDIG